MVASSPSRIITVPVEEKAGPGSFASDEGNGRQRRHLTRKQSMQNMSVAGPVNYVSFLCGLTAGVIQAGLFNPYDRALYLSVKNQTRFLCWENFQSPYQGFFQSVGHRAISGGLYYPLEHFFVTRIPTEATLNGGSPGPFYNFIAGTAAGSVNAIICNPVSAVKYKTWGRDVNRGMVQEALEMLRQGGIRPFCNGLVPTISRDLVFGGTYTFLRFELQYRLQIESDYQWVANFVAAAMATVVSGPFNLARNVQYSTKSRHVADTVREVLAQLAHEVAERRTTYERYIHIQNRLRLGWGTARVALGMSFGHFVYDRLLLLQKE